MKSYISTAVRQQARSPPSRAAWIEIPISVEENEMPESPPSRAAWIEIPSARAACAACSCRRLHGRRGLKYVKHHGGITVYSRRLHGRRGLKYERILANQRIRQSPPSRAAWIEISSLLSSTSDIAGRRLHGRRGLKSADISTKSISSSVAAFTGGVD